MALEQKLSLKLAQKLVMTPSLQQAIKLLQMTRMELDTLLTQELVVFVDRCELLPHEATRMRRRRGGCKVLEEQDGSSACIRPVIGDEDQDVHGAVLSDDQGKFT